MQMLLGALLGIAGILAVAGLATTVRYLRDLNSSLKSVALAFRQSSALAKSIELQNAASFKMVAAMEKMTAAIGTFNGIVLQEPMAQPAQSPWSQEDDRERPFTGRTPPPPFMPGYDEVPGEGESSVLSQTDEELAELDAAQTARDQGIEIDPERAVMPPEDQIVRG
jgi:hypothetical protein